MCCFADVVQVEDLYAIPYQPEESKSQGSTNESKALEKSAEVEVVE
jgi:hypothetical protein